MEKEIKLKYYEDLIKKINNYNYAYYTLDKPLITDKKYEEFYDELVSFEEKNPKLVSEFSPTQRVGGPMLEKFLKAKHTVPLLSLAKAQNYERIKKFFEDVFKEINRKTTFSLELKIDGLAIVLAYKNGILVEVRTRGQDGYGEVVTSQVKTIKSIPLTIEYQGELEVQGEIFMPRDELERLNKKQQEEFHVALKSLENEPTEQELKKLQEKFKPFNERNVASGAVRNLDPKVTASRNLDAFFYNIPYSPTKEFSTQKEMMEFLKEQQFKVNPHFFVFENLEDLIQKIEEVNTFRQDLNYAIDGMVIKVNEVSIREDIGYTSKHPKWAIAYKFEAEEEQTTLLRVEWQVGRTGKHVPVGYVEPVEILGATINKATLNNMDDILRKGVKVGAQVSIRRSNDVIPEILGIIPGSEGEEIKSPTHCASCGSELVEEGAHLFCENHEECPAQNINKIIHFASRGAMNVETFSKKTAEQLLDAGLITNFSDLYTLKREDLLKLERFGEKKADNLLNAIEQSKERPLEAFLYALGIRHSGKGTVERLLRHYSSIEEIQQASVEQLENIEDIGGVVAQSIYDYFHNEKNLEMIKKLKDLGIKMVHEKQETSGNSFENLSFVVTGKLSRPRKEIEAFIKEQGGKISSSVSKNTNFLVVGEDAGSKLTKAQKLGVSTLTEEELYQKI